MLLDSKESPLNIEPLFCVTFNTSNYAFSMFVNGKQSLIES